MAAAADGEGDVVRAGELKDAGDGGRGGGVGDCALEG